MSTPPLAGLVYSTAGRDAAQRSGYGHKIIARSAGVSDAAAQDFDLRAEMGGSVLHADLPEGRAVFTFSRVNDDEWLLNRVVSIGRYRGGHQLLTHGVVLRAEHLQVLDGNPFLLATEESGFAFLDDYPDDAELERLPLQQLGLNGQQARDLNAARFQLLREQFATHELDAAWFPDVMQSLLERARVALVLSPSAAAEALRTPRPELVEWILLHLHPADRTALSFHTLYSHRRPVDYRLLLCVEQDAELVAEQFPGVVIQRELPQHPISEGIGALMRDLRNECVGLGELRQRLIAKPFHHYLAAFADRPPWPSDTRVLNLKVLLRRPLTAVEADLYGQVCRQRDVFEFLRCELLALRAAWDQDLLQFEPAFEDSVARSRGAHLQLSEALALRHGSRPPESERDSSDPPSTTALLELALVDAVATASPVGRPLAWSYAALLRDLVMPSELEVALAGVVDARAGWLEPVIRKYVLSADFEPGQAARGGYWPVHLRWCARCGTGFAAAARDIERLVLAGAEIAARIVALRELGDVCEQAGQDRFAIRLFFQSELPLMVEAVGPIADDHPFMTRVRERLASALQCEFDSGLKGVFEAHPIVADCVFRALPFALVRQGAVRWSDRYRQVLEKVGSVLQTAHAASCGEFAARALQADLTGDFEAVIEASLGHLANPTRYDEFVSPLLVTAAYGLYECPGPEAGLASLPIRDAALTLLKRRAKLPARVVSPELDWILAALALSCLSMTPGFQDSLRHHLALEPLLQLECFARVTDLRWLANLLEDSLEDGLALGAQRCESEAGSEPYGTESAPKLGQTLDLLYEMFIWSLWRQWVLGDDATAERAAGKLQLWVGRRFDHSEHAEGMRKYVSPPRQREAQMKILIYADAAQRLVGGSAA